jgi:predicted dehydrogenase
MLLPTMSPIFGKPEGQRSGLRRAAYWRKDPIQIGGDYFTDICSHLEAFVAAVLDGSPNIAPVDDAAKVIALIQSAYRSASEAQVVRINLE